MYLRWFFLLEGPLRVGELGGWESCFLYNNKEPIRYADHFSHKFCSPFFLHPPLCVSLPYWGCWKLHKMNWFGLISIFYTNGVSFVDQYCQNHVYVEINSSNSRNVYGFSYQEKWSFCGFWMINALKWLKSFNSAIVFDTHSNTRFEIQSLSDTTRVTFLSCLPVNEAKVREGARFSDAYPGCLVFLVSITRFQF